ncbi:reverse transcriptase domain-containing protein [Tanacetum coccineum]
MRIRSELWLSQNKNEKCSKPQAKYSFTPENGKKFYQFIKGVKLPDGFISNFKHKVTNNDTNITGLKSHGSLSLLMQHLFLYGLQQYLPSAVCKHQDNELCSFFKHICSQTLMEADMLKAQSKVVNILCNLELIYPPAFFDIMIYLVIHLPLESEGSIAKGYVVEEALTFSSHYFRDVTTKFNHPARSVDCSPPTCQFQVFRSICKSIGKRSVIRLDHQEFKKVIWYVLHNSLEIDMCRAKFKSQFSNQDMKEEFLDLFGSQICQRYINKDLGVSESSELFSLAYGPTPSPISVNSCIVNSVRFVVYSRDERRTTQNSRICSPVVLFRVKWFDTSNEGRKIKRIVIRNNITQILAHDEAFKNDQYILATQVKQCFYLKDMAKRPPGWKIVQDVNHKKFSTGGVIVVEDDDDVIHFDKSSTLALSTSLDDLDFTTLNIDGQSMDVDAPPDIIDVDEDDDSIDDEDALPHDLADSDDEDLANEDDDDVVVVYSSEEED